MLIRMRWWSSMTRQICWLKSPGRYDPQNRVPQFLRMLYVKPWSSIFLVGGLGHILGNPMMKFLKECLVGGLWMVYGTMEWIMNFPSYWEFHHPNCYSLHHLSEGLVETTNQFFLWAIDIDKWHYPLVICYIAIENDHKNSGFSH